MKLEKLKSRLSICKYDDIPSAAPGAEIWFLAVTDSEISLVCPEEFVPPLAYARDDGWRAFRICGQLDFSLIGILSKISGILAGEGIGIFAVSTYDTDYVLVKEENFEKALGALEAGGYTIV